MSEAQKPVEEVQNQAPATETPAENTTAAADTNKETPAEAPKDTPAESTDANPAPAAESNETPAADQPKEDQKESKEVTPASEGVLGYKAPGLVKGLRFSKRFVYFQDEPVEAKHLSVFHQNEKPAVSNPIAAWASQTGKGLVFLTKRSEDKATPAGIINLADIGDITKEGSEFHFKVNGHKHAFQASSTAERDSWIAALEAKSATAKTEKETITSSEGYKAEYERLTKPAEAAAKKAAENKEAKKEEPKKEEAKEEPKEEPKKETSPAPAADQKASSKSRSQSRKRTSIFGSLLGKKEETEEKKEEKTEEKKEEKAEESKPAEGAAETPAEAPKTEAAEAAPAAESDKKEEQKEDKKEEKEEKKEEQKEEKKPEASNQKGKRTSLFGNFFQKVTSPAHEKSEKEATQAPAETSVASTAPQLENPVDEAAVKPIEPESVTSPTNGEAAKDGATAETQAGENAVGNKDKRRSTSFFGNFGLKKEKKGDSDNEGTDGESKPKNKLGGIFRKPSKAVKTDKKEETPAEESKPEPVPKEDPAEEKPAEEKAAEDKPAENKTEENAKPAEAAAEESKPANVPSTSTTVQAAA